jgi:hypothetical protein
VDIPEEKRSVSQISNYALTQNICRRMGVLTSAIDHDRTCYVGPGQWRVTSTSLLQAAWTCSLACKAASNLSARVSCITG